MLPEQQELTRLETEQAGLEEQVISVELTLETLKTELSQFQYHYNQIIGRLFAILRTVFGKIVENVASAPHRPRKRPMPLLESILGKMSTLSKPQKNFQGAAGLPAGFSG